MVRSCKYICLLAVISLTVGVIWPDFSVAAQAPQLELLGEIKAGLRVPSRIDVDSTGNLYVADTRLQKVFKFDKFGQQVLLIEQEKISGAGLAVSPSGDRIYASAFDKVVVFNGAGELLGYLGAGAGEFVAAGSIVLNSQGDIYVTDLNRRQVKVFTSDGTSAGQLPFDFIINSSLAYKSSAEQIYLTDSVVERKSGLEPKVSVYDHFGGLQTTISSSTGFGTSPVRFFGGMAFDTEDRFYVGDIEDMTIRVLDAAGAQLLNFSRPGLSRPLSMAFDAVTNRLFVVQADDKIDIYGIDGAQNPVARNSIPEPPVPVAPIGGSEVPVLRPSLSFNNAFDPDLEDQLSYNVRVFDAGQNLVASLTVVEQPTETSALLDSDLLENGYYRWQVQAFDGQAESGWSELQSFYVNAVQEAPSIPVLTSPLAGTAVKKDALLAWLSASDADPFDTLTYLLEVATDANFGTLIYREELSATEISLASWSDLVQPGQTCYWRITATDNHGLQAVSNDDGRFLFQASLLQVTANMPAARVYLGGNQGYAGQFIGEAPFELRDLPAGRYQLVVERAGFEPFYQPIDIQLDAATRIYVELRPALEPTKLTFKPIKVAGKPIRTGSVVTPLLADFNLDGVEDLLLAYADGSLHYHPGTLRKVNRPDAKVRKLRFAAEQVLSLPQLAGGTPLLVDWNNDYQQDLLVGGVDGSVWLYLNWGDFVYSEEPVLLAAVSGAAVPAVADIDGDGDKDLLVGSGDGELVLFSNLVSDEEPQLAEPQTLVTFAEAAAPSFADWNGDGQRELLIASEGQVYQAIYSAGTLTELKLLPIKRANVARLFAHDLDHVNGKELIVGSASGELLLGHSQKNGKRYVAAFYPALVEKLQQLEQQVTAEAGELLPSLQPLFRALEKRKLGRLAKQAKALFAQLPKESIAAEIASELVTILK